METRRYIVSLPLELAIKRHDRAMAGAVLPYLFSRLMDVDYILGATPLYGEEVVQDVLEMPELDVILTAVRHHPSPMQEKLFAEIAENLGGFLANLARRMPGELMRVHHVEIIDAVTLRLEFVPRSFRAHYD